MPYGTIQADKIQGSINSFSPDSSFFRNRIINGAMVIDQRNAGASISVSVATYIVDRFVSRISYGSGHTGQRSTVVPAGFSNSQLITVGTGSSPAAGDIARTYQVIEGFNIADLGWGTASAQTVTLSFWVRSSVTGTFSGALYGASTIQSYAFNYTISAANTWEQKSVTIAGPTTGTWDSTNGAGIFVNFDLGSGTNFKTTAGSWTTGTFIGVTGSVNLCATSGATFYITGVQLEVGSTATSFGFRPYGTELQLCQRYARLCGAGFVGVATASATNSQASMTFGQTMRASPTVSLVSGASVSFVTGEEVQTASSPGINTVYLQPNGICIRISGFTATGSRGDQRVTQSTTDNWLLVTAEL